MKNWYDVYLLHLKLEISEYEVFHRAFFEYYGYESKIFVDSQWNEYFFALFMNENDDIMATKIPHYVENLVRKYKNDTFFDYTPFSYI